MSTGTFIDGLFSTPLVLPAPFAGALAALIVVLLAMAMRRPAGGNSSRVILSIVALVAAGVAIYSVLDRLTINERSAERRSLLDRKLQLGLAATAAGSSLACLDGVAGEDVENACEKAIFADAQSAARAVTYVAARFSLLSDAVRYAKSRDPELLNSFAATRRAVELDRYGIAAHVLAVRDGCTAEKCGAFAILQDAATLKANLKVHAFETYIGRYAAAWGNAAAPAVGSQPQSLGSGSAPVASAVEPLSPAHPLDSRYDFPSAASIPPVSIMNNEPVVKENPATTGGNGTPDKTGATTPVPPKRPQAQATPPAPR